MNARRTGAVSATLLTVLGVSLSLGFVRVAAPGWAERVGLDVWNAPDVRDDSRRIDRDRRELEARRERLFAEIAIARRVAAQVADGTRTVREAVDVLEPILRHRDGFEVNCRLRWKAPTLRHGVARYVIEKVLALVEGDSTRTAEVSARLEAEYAGIR